MSELSVRNAMRPEIGRVVIFQEMRVNQQESTFRCVPVPAIVQAENDDDTLSLWVFGFSEVARFPSVKHGSGPCEWEWPEVASSAV